jgi:hypothetical protein
MKMPKTDIPDTQNDRKKRLADALRQNLQLRKARVRAGESGDATQNAAVSTKKADQD